MEACPKCGTARDEARTHCRTCGLAHDKMASFAKARDAVPEPLTAAWDRAVEAWDDTTRHDELLRLVTQHDAYAWAVARYRERGDAVHLDRITRAAEVQMTSSAAVRAAKTPEPYRMTMAILVVLVVLVIAGMVYAIARGKSEPKGADIRPPGPPPTGTK